MKKLVWIAGLISFFAVRPVNDVIAQNLSDKRMMLIISIRSDGAFGENKNRQREKSPWTECTAERHPPVPGSIGSG
jgi:hypothetical protein